MEALRVRQRKQSLQFGRQHVRVHNAAAPRNVPIYFAIGAVEITSLVRIKIDANRETMRALGDHSIHEAIPEKLWRPAERAVDHFGGFGRIHDPRFRHGEAPRTVWLSCLRYRFHSRTINRPLNPISTRVVKSWAKLVLR